MVEEEEVDDITTIHDTGDEGNAKDTDTLVSVSDTSVSGTDMPDMAMAHNANSNSKFCSVP